MAFLSPWFLTALIAMAIPVVIHLIRRDRPEVIPFSTLRFIARPPRINALLQRLQQWLLLALRMAIIALVALAFARPFLTGELAAISGVEPSATVILLDRSRSMSYRDHDRQARDAAIELIAGSQPGDHVAVVAFGDSTEAVFDLSDDLRGAERFVATLSAPSYSATRYLPALRLAARILEDLPYPRREVALISDFQAQGMNHFDREWRLPPGVALRSIRVGDEAMANLAVTDLRLPEALVREEEQVELSARVRNLGTTPIAGTRLTLTLDGELIDSREADLSKRSEAVVTFRAKLARGAHTGVVEIAGDSFPDDDRFHFAIQVLPRIAVLLVNGEPAKEWLDDEGHWFRLATAGSEESRFDVVSVEYSRADEVDLAGFEAIALLNVAEVGGVLAGRLDRYLRRGGSVLVALGDRVRAESYNRWLGAQTLQPQYVRLNDEYLVLADVDRRHPIFKGIGAAHTDWGMRTRAYWPLARGDSGEALMRFDNGEPALIERPLRGGRLLLFATTLDTEWNDLPLQGMYLPFLHETLRYLAARPDTRRFYRVGESVPVPIAGAAYEAVVAPDGHEQKLVEGRDGRAHTPPLAMPGFHRVTGGAGELEIAVNGHVEESDFTRLPRSELEDLVVNSETRPAAPPQVLAARMDREVESDQRIWWWLLLAVLISASVESVIANRTYR